MRSACRMSPHNCDRVAWLGVILIQKINDAATLPAYIDMKAQSLGERSHIFLNPFYGVAQATLRRIKSSAFSRGSGEEEMPKETQIQDARIDPVGVRIVACKPLDTLAFR